MIYTKQHIQSKLKYGSGQIHRLNKAGKFTPITNILTIGIYLINDNTAVHYNGNEFISLDYTYIADYMEHQKIMDMRDKKIKQITR